MAFLYRRVNEGKSSLTLYVVDNGVHATLYNLCEQIAKLPSHLNTFSSYVFVAVATLSGYLLAID